jgi:hypothetical protein
MENSDDKELKSKLIKSALEKILRDLSDIDFYYTPTIDIATEIKKRIDSQSLPESVTRDERELIENLSQKDIQIHMSFSTSCC